MNNMTENALELLKMQKRFTKWNVAEGYKANELPEWFRNAFRRAPHNTSEEDLALGVEKLLAWNTEHPEPRTITIKDIVEAVFDPGSQNKCHNRLVGYDGCHYLNCKECQSRPAPPEMLERYGALVGIEPATSKP